MTNGEKWGIGVLSFLLAGGLFALIRYKMKNISVPATDTQIPTDLGAINNFGNIEKSSVEYQGEIVPSPSSVMKSFQSPEYGFRAMIEILRHYYKEGLTTLSKMITKYAPPSENDTEAYIKYVSTYTGIDPDADMNDVLYSPQIKDVVNTMAIHEQGIQYTFESDILQKAYDLA